MTAHTWKVCPQCNTPLPPDWPHVKCLHCGGESQPYEHSLSVVATPRQGRARKYLSTSSAGKRFGRGVSSTVNSGSPDSKKTESKAE